MSSSRKLFVLLATIMGLCGILYFGHSVAMSKPVDKSDSVGRVAGKIVFQSNREGQFSEIWMLENGDLKKLAGTKSSKEEIPDELPEPYKGMFADVFGGMSEPKISPDGSKILCVAKEKLLIINVEDKEIQTIKPQKSALSARWAPEGNSLYYTAPDFLPGLGLS